MNERRFVGGAMIHLNPRIWARAAIASIAYDAAPSYTPTPPQLPTPRAPPRLPPPALRANRRA
jgi:hypothetical protein